MKPMSTYSPTIALLALLALLMLMSACITTSSSSSQNPLDVDHLSGLSTEARAIIFLNTLPDLDAYAHLGEVRCQVQDNYQVAISRCRSELRESAAALGGDIIIPTAQFNYELSFVEMYGEVFRSKPRTANASD